MDPSPLEQVIVIGASAGSVKAMLAIAAALPANFGAPILLVQHIGAHRSYLPELLSNCGPNRALAAQTGDWPQAGTIHVAPPDHHMLIEAGRIRLWRGPKEQHARPAINPLFRSAALGYGPRATGVILTGMLDDGTAGLKAIKDCGGIAVVQDPFDASEPGMPRSALANVAVDHVARLVEMLDLLVRLAQSRHRRAGVEAPTALRIEHAVSLGEMHMEHLATIGEPSAFTCPDCGGALFELHDKKPVRYLCHTGHAYSLRGLAQMQGEVTEAAIWSSVRALQEKEALLRRLAAVQAAETPGSDAAALREADELMKVLGLLRKVAEEAPSVVGFDTVT